MAKSKKIKTGLDKDDLWKFVPKKIGKGLPSICAAIVFEDGHMKATNFSEIMAVPSDTEVNFPIGVSMSTLTPLYKSKDWPKSIRGYVELVEGKKQMKAEITTEKGHTFWVKDYELFDAADFPQEVGNDLLNPEEGVDFSVEYKGTEVMTSTSVRRKNSTVDYLDEHQPPVLDLACKGEITEYDVKIISCCADFCELARTQNVNEAIWDIDVEKGQMRGFDVNMGATFPTALEECRISLGVAKYCLEGGNIFYGTIKTGQHFVRVEYADGSWIAGRVGDRVYPQVENLFEDDLKVWFEVTAKAYEWKRIIGQMLVYWQKGRQVRISTESINSPVVVSMFEFAPNQKRECIDVEACPRVEMECKHYTDGPNSFAFNPKLLKVQLDQFPDHANVTLQFYGVHGMLDKMGEIVHRHKPLRIFTDSMSGRRLLMPVMDWSQRIHTGEGVTKIQDCR